MQINAKKPKYVKRNKINPLYEGNLREINFLVVYYWLGSILFLHFTHLTH